MTDDFAGLPTYDVLAADEPDARRKPATWWVVGGVVALVTVLIGGITYGAASLSGGGGVQPEDALPAGAIAFAKVDLDPAASQKVDAIRFMRKFPTLKKHLAGDADLRKVLFDSVADDAGWKKANFADDVAPWLGQRVGVAAYSPKTFPHKSKGQSATVVVALQVSNEDQARKGLDKLIATSHGSTKPGYVVQDGYALLAESTPVAQSLADGAAKGTLAKAPKFAADIADLDDGIATFWIDASGADSLLSTASMAGIGLPGATGALGSQLSTGRVVYSLRFDGPNVLEVAGQIKGATKNTAPYVKVKGFADLPSTTVAAIGLGGGAGAVDSAWASFRKQAGADAYASAVAQAEQEFGMHLPADLKVLLGSNMLLALDGAGLGDGNFEVGARVTTSDAKRADALIGRITSSLGGRGLGVPEIRHQVTSDGYVVATSAAEAKRLTGSSGKKLRDLDVFRTALPDVDKAQFALWIDPQGVLVPILGERGGSDLKPIAGFGLTASSKGSGNGSFRARLVIH